MLEALNRYAHGFVTVPVVVALREKGLFERLRSCGGATVEQLRDELGANEGHLRAALRLLQALGWIEEEEGQLWATPEAEHENEVPADAAAALRLPLEAYLAGSGPERLLDPWIERCRRRWGAKSPRVADLLDGTLAVRTLAALERTAALEGGPGEVIARVAPSAREELGRLFDALGWARVEEGEPVLTDVGRFILDRALIVGTLAAYTPMLSRMPELLFGDPARVFRRDDAGQERHVDRTLNVASSGFQHDRYFADVDDLLVATFDALPLESQPRYVADMGCGDGTFLKRVYETVRSRTRRGRSLDESPLTLVGVDFNDAALEATRRTLAGLPCLLLKGDIGDPEALLASLGEAGVDSGAVLHIRSFLDHDRPFVPGDEALSRRRSRLGHPGVYVDGRGASIPPAAMVQSLVEHLRRWGGVLNRHGLVVLEVHSLDPRTANAYFDSTESIHFDAYHAFSMQYLVEAADFLGASAEAGLFPRSGCSRRYPRTLPFTRISLHWLERRPYVIRPAHPDDVPALAELERASSPLPLAAAEEELRARLEREPAGQLVLEKDGRVVAAAYSQRIADAGALETARHQDLPGLRAEGPVVQLLGLVVHPEFAELGLGDELLEFVLQRSELLPGVERVAGVSRCRGWTRGTGVAFAEHVFARTAAGEPEDPILRFHARHGARIRAVVPGYRPADEDNDGCGVVIEYDLADRRSGARNDPSLPTALGEGRVAQVVEASVREVLGPRRRDAFAPGTPLMDMGLDSMDLTELKSLLGRRLGLSLDPTLFFRHRTPATVAEHLRSRLEPATRTAAPLPPSAPAVPAADAGSPSPVRPARVGAVPRPPRPHATDRSVAIVGMACRFASADSVDEYWALLRDGVHAIRTAPPGRRGWARTPVDDPDPAVASAVRYGGFLDGVDAFDAAFFGISPREARSMDPQQRLLLETCWHAFEDAAIDPTSRALSATGVFVGICTHDYEVLQLLTGSPQAFDSHFTSGNLASVAAGRIAYCYGFHGPALSVDTACSSSLVAVHLASQSLRAGECDVALACGVNLMLAREMSLVYARLRVLAPDGRCKTFDASADGYARGEGCGVVVLKRLEQAVADGDRVLAVIRGSAVNQDGPSNGLTAPNGDAQEAVIRQALAASGVSPLDVSHVEAHGTGTVIGDPIEVQALGRVFGPGRPAERPLVIGSAKTTVGHIEPAAGLAGLIKVVLSLQNEWIPSHLHLREPNPLVRLEDIPAVVPTQGRPWPREDGRPRLAGVSSFGLSGTNAHAIVEEAAAAPTPERGRSRRLQILPLSARSPAALADLARAYETLVRAQRDLRPRDVCFTAAAGRAHLEHRLAVLFEQREELLEALSRLGHGATAEAPVPARAVRGVSAGRAPRIAFLFSGQGAQYPGMGGELFDTEPVFREAIERCDAVLREDCGVPLVALLYPRGTPPDLTETKLLQPALFAVEYALSRLWQSWGVEPEAVMGHSLGEYTAACIAGVLDLDDALRLVAARGRLMGGLEERGTMVALAAEAGRVAAAITGREGEVSIASLNGPASVVVSGRSAAVAEVASALESEGVRARGLAVSNAFHSPLMDPILDAFEEEVRRVVLRPPRQVLVSNLYGRPVTDEVTLPAYWRRHLREAVRFGDCVNSLLQAGYDAFVEVGPGATLLGLGRLQPDSDSRAWLASLRGEAEAETVLESVAALWARGVPVDWAAFHRGAGGRKVALPAYPFERKSYWFDEGARAPVPAPGDDAVTGPGQVVSEFYDAFAEGHPSTGVQYLTFAPLPEVIPGFSWVEAFAHPEAHRDTFALFAEGQAEIRAMLFRHVDLARCTRVLDFGCGYGADLVDLARRHPHLSLCGFTLSGRQLAIASDRARAEGVASRVRFVKGDSSRDPLPADNDVVFGFEVAHHVKDKAALFANLTRHLREDGHLLLADFVSTTGFAIEHPGTSSFFPSRAEWVDLLSSHQLLVTECVDVSREVSHSLNDPRFEENLESALRDRRQPRVEAAFRSFDQLGKLLARRLALYVLVAARRRPDLGSDELVRRNREALEAPRPYSEIALSHGCYEVEWKQKDGPPAPAGGPGGLGRWLVLADAGGVGEELERRLAARGGTCVRVLPGPGLERTGPDEWRVSPESVEGLRTLFQEVSRLGPLRGLVHLWSLDAPGSEDLTLASLREEQRLGVESVLHVVQALQGVTATPRLWLVTQGALPIGGRLRVASAPLAGLAKTLAIEVPELWGGMVDLGPGEAASEQASALAGELTAPDREYHVAYRLGARRVARLVRRRPPAVAFPPLRADASYLIAGGLGALGLRVAAWLVERGARQLVLVGRRSPDDRAREAIARLEEAGARVTTFRADISAPDDVASLLATIADTLPPLRGVVNAAGVLDDGVLLQQTAARFREVMAPKVDGSWNLHAQTKGLPLDFFVLFSSSASLLALPGRSSYAAANAFLDALSHHRRQCGLAGLSVNWGGWSEAGMAARLGPDLRRQLAQRGMGDVETRPGLDMLGALIVEGKAQTGVFPINWTKLFRDTHGPVPPYFEHVAVSAAEVPQGGPGAGVLTELRACPSGQRASRLAEWIRQEVAGVLGTHSASAVDPEKGFWAMGMDSLLSLELRNRLQSALGRRLDATLTMNHPNVNALARYLGGQLELDLTGPEVAVASRERSTGHAADAIDDLAESEVEALLRRRLDDMELGKG